MIENLIPIWSQYILVEKTIFFNFCYMRKQSYHFIDGLGLATTRKNHGYGIPNDGTHVEFENWQNTKCDNLEDSCAAMDAKTGFWQSKPCNNLYGIVCKVPTMKQRETTSTTTLSTETSILNSDSFTQSKYVTMTTTYVLPNISILQGVRTRLTEVKNRTSDKRYSQELTTVNKVLIVIVVNLVILVVFLVLVIDVFKKYIPPGGI